MFGYVVTNQPELKVKELEQYRSYYCGLCMALKETGGMKGRICLSYDLTFLILLLSGLYEPEETVTNRRCILHPLSKHKIRENQLFSYVADMSLLLTWYKCKDDFADERKLGKAFYGKTIEGKVKKIRQKYERQDKAAAKYMEELAALEQQKECNIDLLSGCFGHVLEEIFVYRQDEWEKSLRKMGFYMGKFIYILDAYDDLEQDEKKGCFNPFLAKSREQGFDEYIKNLLTMAAAEFAREFEILPILENAGILRNILYSGVWTRYEQVKIKRQKEREKFDEKSV
jgi:hypothetical protein